MASKNVLRALDRAADEVGIPREWLHTIVSLESGFNPKARSGSYKGLGQLSDTEFKKYGSGNIYNVKDNALATARSLKSRMRSFKRRVGREPTLSQLYMTHQQGRAGAAAHAKNPKGVAWKNIRPYYSEAEAKRRGFKNADEYAQAAIWKNLPESARKRFGNVNNVTSADFSNWWDRRVGRAERQFGESLQTATEPTAGLQLPARKPNPKFFTPEKLDQVFGAPFGQLYQNELKLPAVEGSKGLLPDKPLLSGLLPEKPILSDFAPDKPILRDAFNSLFS